jgi:hypothetical protein
MTPLRQDESPERCKFLYLRWKWDGPPWIAVTHHRVQVVSGSVTYFLMNEECSFATSLKNILRAKKSYRRFFKKIFFVISAVYKDNKQTNGKIFGLQFRCWAQVNVKTSLHDAWFTLAANIPSQSYRWWWYENRQCSSWSFLTWPWSEVNSCKIIWVVFFEEINTNHYVK